MITLKRENLLNTKWDVSAWTQEMKTRWQEKMFEYGFSWPISESEVWNLDASEYYIEQDGELAYSHSPWFYQGVNMISLSYNDIPSEESQTTYAITGSGVHVEEGGVNDTRKNTPDKETSALDTLRKVCQEHGLYMTLDPHGEVAVTEVSSDVEYEVKSEDQLQKLLSALEVLNSYVKH